MEAPVWLCLRLLPSSGPPPHRQARPAVAKQRQGSYPRPAPTERQGGPVAKNSGSFFPPSPRHEAFIGETLSNNRNITLRFSQSVFPIFIYHQTNGDEMPDSNPIFWYQKVSTHLLGRRSAPRPPLICSPTWGSGSSGTESSIQRITRAFVGPHPTHSGPSAFAPWDGSSCPKADPHGGTRDRPSRVVSRPSPKLRGVARSRRNRSFPISRLTLSASGSGRSPRRDQRDAGLFRIGRALLRAEPAEPRSATQRERFRGPV